MASWKQILDEARALGGTYDVIRRRYLKELSDLTGRNAIVYYSGWLQKSDLQRQGFSGFEINDSDKNGFMAAVHGLDRAQGLDLIIHTPGGDLAAVESLADYLRSMFTDIRAVVPQLAMSGGTILALLGREILMGKHSNLGPIDPQFGGLPAHGIVEEFEKAKKEMAENPATSFAWNQILGKYPPTFIGQCEKAILWGNEIASDLLCSGMFKDEADAKAMARKVVEGLTDNLVTKSHARHVSMARAQNLGLKIEALEDNQELQEAVLTVHHACVQTLAETSTVKIIENQNGDAYITGVRVEASGTSVVVN